MSGVPDQLPLLERFKYVVFLLISIMIGLGVVILLSQRPAPTTLTVIPPAPTLTPLPTLVPSATPTPGPYMVYVTGAVAQPEAVVTLTFGSRVLHAIEAAGGALENANLSGVNLAQRLNDGDQVHVPTRKPETENETAAPIQILTSTQGVYTVYVTGEVVYPQTMISLPSGSRVQDAIEAAGGATSNADLARVNLSQILNDGDQVHIPPLIGDDIQTATPNHLPLVHINSATVDELDALPGIGPSLAQAIIDYRTEHGPFASLEDLDEVPGIGPATLEELRPLIVFD